MKHQLLALAIAISLLPGCVTYLIADDVAADRTESERAHVFAFHRDQATRMADGGACGKAATHFEKQFVPHEQSAFGPRIAGHNSTPFTDENLAALDERIKAAARTLTDTCLNKEAPALQQQRRFERLAELFRRLALLPLPDDERAALALRADTTDLLRADAAVEDAEKAWAAGKIYDALSGFWNAKNIAAGVKAATDEQKAKYARLVVEKERAHVDDMVKKADAAARAPATAHLAAVYLARAYEVSKDAALGRRLEAVRQELLASHVFQWQVQFKGEPSIATAAQAVLKSHAFTGNLKPGAREFVAVVDIGAFTVTPSEREGSRTGEYKTGSRSVDNPEYRELQTYVMNQQQCLQNIPAYNFRGSNSVDAMKQRTGCSYYCSSVDCARQGNLARLNEAKAKLNKTPMTKQEDLMAPWSYATREWSQVIKAPVQLSLKRALSTAPQTSTTTLQHEYTDHAHDLVPQLGLGPKQIARQSDAELATSAGQKLGLQVVGEIEKDYQAWFAATPQQGDRGAVLFTLLGGDAKHLDATLEAKTGVKNSHAILVAR